MSQERDADGRLLGDEERITRLGQWLRKTSLDELPELVNVVRGEMSLVGPRPLVKAYLPRYSPEQARRHEVKPGLTGLAQVSGRNALSWSERFALDVHYVDHQSLALDLRILALTVAKLLSGQGRRRRRHAAVADVLRRRRRARRPGGASLGPRARRRRRARHRRGGGGRVVRRADPNGAGGRGKHSDALGHPSR